MDDKNKRLSRMKLKLQQYKRQKQEQECSKSDTLSKSQESLESLSSLLNEECNNVEDVSSNHSIQSPPVLPPVTQQLSSEEGTNESLDTNREIIIPSNVPLEKNVVIEQEEEPTPCPDNEEESVTEPIIILTDAQNTSKSDKSEEIAVVDVELPEVKLCPENILQHEEKLATRTAEKSTQCEHDEAAAEVSQNMNDVMDNLQFELGKLRQENSTLMSRESELIQQLEAGERLVRDLRKEVNQFKQLGNQQKQLQELQDAIIVVSKSKMTIAEELNNEQDKNKELLDSLSVYESELKSLRSENSQLVKVQSQLEADMNSLRSRLEEELKKNQILEDQRRRHMEQLQSMSSSVHETTRSSHHDHHGQHSHIHNEGEHSHSSECTEHHHNGHSHKDEHHHDHDEHEHHDHDHQHSISAEQNTELIEMHKTLKRLEWENTTYKTELAKLAPVSMTMKQLEPRVVELQDKNLALKEEVDRLEHLVIQLQGENDTIGDYITLYQSQRIALRQHAKENDRLVVALSKERNDLLIKLSELNHAVDELAKQQQQQQNGSVIEEKIRDLIVDVNSKVNETFSCSTCSGSRLMTV